MDQSLRRSLVAVGTLMKSANDPWWIIASAAVALHGADAGHVADVDMLLSVDDAQRLLPTIGVPVACGTDNADFQSGVFGTWAEPPLPVEFMADFKYRTGSDWTEVQPTTRKLIQVNDVALFIPCRDELTKMLRAFGRPKDLDRAQRLEGLSS